METRELRVTAEQHNQSLDKDGEHIRALVRIAEIHSQPISDLEGDSPQ